MKNSLFYVIFICNFMLNSSFSTEMLGVPEVKRNLEYLRPGNVYDKIDLQSFPKATSVKDCFQLCEFLTVSVKEYWEDSLRLMLNDNPQLRIIINLLKSNVFDLKLRIQVLGKDEYNDPYQMYKSYDISLLIISSDA